MFYFKNQEEEHAWSTLNFNTEVTLPLVNVPIHANIYGFRSSLHIKQRNPKWFLIENEGDLTSLVDMQTHAKIVRASEKCSIMTFIDVDIRHRMEPLWML